MKNSGEPPAKRLKIEEEENINVEVDVLDEEVEMEEEEMVEEDALSQSKNNVNNKSRRYRDPKSRHFIISKINSKK